MPEVLEATLVLVVVVVEQVIATLDASWTGKTGLRHAVAGLKEGPERQMHTISAGLVTPWHPRADRDHIPPWI